jgi:hypothetical protein
MGGFGSGKRGGKPTIGGTRSYGLSTKFLRDHFRAQRPGFKFVCSCDADEISVMGVVDTRSAKPRMILSHKPRYKAEKAETYEIALRGMAPLSRELGIHVCGGRGSHSRKTPDELVSIGDRVGFDGSALATASRLVAKVDSAAVQDGFDLYLHSERKQARRYHWRSEGLRSFVEERFRDYEQKNESAWRI